LASHCQSLPILCRYCSALFWKLDQITPCRWLSGNKLSPLLSGLRYSQFSKSILLMTCSKPKALTKSNLVAPIFQVVFPMCAEPDEEGLEEDELSAHKVQALRNGK
jgi:hypothetical protein